MLIEIIKKNPILSLSLRPDCKEHDVCVEVDSSVSTEDYLIIDVDHYYKSLHLEKTPASPDCLIIQKCADNTFSIYVVELKDIKAKESLPKENTREKFETCLNDFMRGRFRSIFYETEYEIGRVALYLVTDLYNQLSNADRQRKTKNTKLDALLAMNTKPYYFHGKRYAIRHEWPNPLIKPC